MVTGISGKGLTDLLIVTLRVACERSEETIAIPRNLDANAGMVCEPSAERGLGGWVSLAPRESMSDGERGRPAEMDPDLDKAEGWGVGPTGRGGEGNDLGG